MPKTAGAPLLQQPLTAPGAPVADRDRPARRPRVVATAEASGHDLTLAQLLCARLCHDLIGPAAAVNAGHELLRESACDREAGELVVESGQQLAARLAFFRAAFGHGGAAGAGLADARALADGFLAGRRVTVAWPEEETADGALTADALRVLLCLLMLAAEGLPRGGEVRVALAVKAASVRLAVVASGTTVRVADEVAAALRSDRTSSLTARTAPVAYLARLVRGAGGRLSLRLDDQGRLCLEAVLPDAQPEPRRAAA